MVHSLQLRCAQSIFPVLWQRIRKERGETWLPYFYAFVMGVFAACALDLNTLCLAQTIDILSIADPALQYLAAGGVAALSMGILRALDGII
ncbi:MAG: hypothetical protein P4K83_11695 [Terracidiphilus sp.]|nr:hypothetical protein [Terracidiphilus sp.]